MTTEATQATAAAKAGEKSMVDAMGNVVPLRYVSAYDRKRDAAVRQILTEWQKTRKAMEAVMARTLARLDTVIAARLEDGHEKAERGNVQVSSFDGLVTVSCDQRYDIHLDDRVREARDRLFAYARGLAEKLDGDDKQTLLSILEDTFKASQDGRLSTARVLSLIRMKVTAPAWREAIELLVTSIETRRGKAYVRVTVRPDRQHDPVPVRLDIADCWPEVKA